MLAQQFVVIRLADEVDKSLDPDLVVLDLEDKFLGEASVM